MSSHSPIVKIFKSEWSARPRSVFEISAKILTKQFVMPREWPGVVSRARVGQPSPGRKRDPDPGTSHPRMHRSRSLTMSVAPGEKHVAPLRYSASALLQPLRRTVSRYQFYFFLCILRSNPLNYCPVILYILLQCRYQIIRKFHEILLAQNMACLKNSTWYQSSYILCFHSYLLWKIYVLQLDSYFTQKVHS